MFKQPLDFYHNYVISSPAMDMNRRAFIKKTTLLTASFTMAVLGGYAFAGEPYRLKTVAYDLASPKWPKNMPPLHVAFAADLHVGCPSVGLDRLAEIVEHINSIKADIIVLPGDFLTRLGDDSRLMGEYVPPRPAAAVLRRLKAPQGVYATLGNHDWACDGMGMWQELESAGIHVLENDALRIKSLKHDFWVAGLADDTTRKPDWKKIEAKLSDDAPVILLSHDPGTFLDKAERPVVMLAGHMHAGQVSFPGSDMLDMSRPNTRAPSRYKYGHISEEGRDLIVTSGIGTSRLPVRFNACPEVVSLKIRSA